jgi:hypothetical protein
MYLRPKKLMVSKTRAIIMVSKTRAIIITPIMRDM